MKESVKKSIERALSVLIGLPLIGADRALDLEMFHFGKAHTISTRRGGEKEIGEYALHVQCAWRIAGPHGIIVASQDRNYPGDGSYDVPDDFDWTLPGNRCDTCLKAFLKENAPRSTVVKLVEADSIGGAKLVLVDGFTLEVFPDSSFADDASEHWRFFQTLGEGNHFVVTGYGIQE